MITNFEIFESNTDYLMCIKSVAKGFTEGVSYSARPIPPTKYDKDSKRIKDDYGKYRTAHPSPINSTDDYDAYTLASEFRRKADILDILMKKEEYTIFSTETTQQYHNREVYKIGKRFDL